MDQLCRHLGFIMLDLRQFKLANDTRGHLAGDQILMEVARVLQSRVRSQDSIIRMGGDEFLVVLTNCSEEVVSRKNKELGEVLLCRIFSAGRVLSAGNAGDRRPPDVHGKAAGQVPPAYIKRTTAPKGVPSQGQQQNRTGQSSMGEETKPFPRPYLRLQVFSLKMTII